ncbi:MAG TPA: hypothetical protein VIG06_07940 [Kofleriaceae bacterium]|jgi:hypothetical protein
MSIVRPIALVLTLTAAAACGSSEPPASGTQTNAQEMRAPEVKASVEQHEGYDTCVAAFNRQRECTDAFIPALVDARVRTDHPAGIAAKDKELGRDALVAGALEEWKSDSTDEAIHATCTKITDDELEGAPELIQKAEACLKETDCNAFSACAVDIATSRW